MFGVLLPLRLLLNIKDSEYIWAYLLVNCEDPDKQSQVYGTCSRMRTLNIRRGSNSLTTKNNEYVWAYEIHVDSENRLTDRPRNLIRIFVVPNCILRYPKCAKWKFWSDCANAQADLNFRWAHLSEGTFSVVVSHLIDSSTASSTQFAWFARFISPV